MYCLSLVTPAVRPLVFRLRNATVGAFCFPILYFLIVRKLFHLKPRKNDCFPLLFVLQ